MINSLTTRAKKGLFEAADKGTIFLDEIGDLPFETQVRLLRVIQERQFTPIGETAPTQVDVRIIAATNIDLKEAVKKRSEDILPFAQHFIRKYNRENRRVVSENLSPEVLSLLENYYYPGNVRELENIIERAIVIAPTDEITAECLRPEVGNPEFSSRVMRDGEGVSREVDLARGVIFFDEVRRFEMDLIRRALDQTRGHQANAAKLLGLNTTTLNSKIKTLNISLDY